MEQPSSTTACPLTHPSEVVVASRPSPGNLSYSLTLPAAPASAAVARAAVRAALHRHGLDGLAAATVQAVGELAACAARFTSADSLHLSLRHRDGALRVVVHDGHPRHTHPRLAAACDARRRAALRVLGRVVQACGGTWGVDAAREPAGGTRTWAVLPEAGTQAYGEPRHPSE
jgi:hypothetical protein